MKFRIIKEGIFIKVQQYDDNTSYWETVRIPISVGNGMGMSYGDTIFESVESAENYIKSFEPKLFEVIKEMEI